MSCIFSCFLSLTSTQNDWDQSEMKWNHLTTIDFQMQPQEGAAHLENVLITKMDLLTYWTSLVHFSVGSSVCLRAFHLVLPLILPTSAGLTGCCAERRQGLLCNNRWDLPHTAASMTCWLYFTEWTLSFIVKWNYYTFLLRYLRKLKKWVDFSSCWERERRWVI